jgi:hypothetical protein
VDLATKMSALRQCVVPPSGVVEAGAGAGVEVEEEEVVEVDLV